MNVWDLKNGAGLWNDNATWDDPANTFFRMLQSSSWCWPTERTETGENDKQHQQAERDSQNVSERSHWMKKCGSCRENLQLWPHFLTLVPFLWMINLYIVQCSQLQYDSHVSAENATSSSKIPQLSIYCYHFTSIFHRQMIIHASCSLELNLKPVFLFFFQIYTLFLSHLLCTVSLLVRSHFFSVLSFVSNCLSFTLCPGNKRLSTRLYNHKIVTC